MQLSDTQKESIQQFCEHSIRKRKIETDFRSRSKSHNTAIKECKEKIHRHMESNDLKYAKIQLDGEKATYFCTLGTKVSQRRFDDKIVGYGVDSFLQDGLKGDNSFDTTEELVEEITRGICEHINLQRRSEKVTFSITRRKPAKVTVDEIEDLDDSVSIDLGKRMHRSEATIQKWKKVKKTHLTSIKTEIGKSEPHIKSFMETNKIQSQRVTMRDQDTPRCFYIRQKVSAKKPTLKKTDIYNIVRSGVRKTINDHDIHTYSEVQPITSRESLRTNILEALDSMPKTQTVCLKLDKGRFRPSPGSKSSESVEGEEEGEETLPETGLPTEGDATGGAATTDTFSAGSSSIFDENDDEDPGVSEVTLDDTVSGFTSPTRPISSTL